MPSANDFGLEAHNIGGLAVPFAVASDFDLAIGLFQLARKCIEM